MKLKKCENCNELVNVINDCECENCSIKCCNKEMKELIPNSVEASFEKHIPEVIKENNELLVKVNHVMDDDHYIEFISYAAGDLEITKYFKPGEVATIKFPYKENSKVYSYCNKHGLWMQEVK